ncbi:MAG: hypothetical protein Harvfovirus1_67 [Harvfovirus sp.]|uniref:Uncharacterized protein n=1 Tax=Harvfovirus sp. TaxID=2487768 RepID=A0A3G4ZZX0_9VIRU|nr:MAG: hypothetical protein Harvfovirus1_67 [Harvfovirus sp.]
MNFMIGGVEPVMNEKLVCCMLVVLFVILVIGIILIILYMQKTDSEKEESDLQSWGIALFVGSLFGFCLLASCYYYKDDDED